MASSLIHMAVASEINKKLKRDNTKILIGSIAPDLAQNMGESKFKSHFLDENNGDVPNMTRFLMKYKSKLNDDFVMGYFIHLYTDYFWVKHFVPELHNKYRVTKKDGTIVKCNEHLFYRYIYSDYTNLNPRLLDEYNMELKAFYNDLPEFDNIINEIPMDKLNIIVDRVSLLIKNATETKEYVIDFDNVRNFINLSTELILSKIEELEGNKEL